MPKACDKIPKTLALLAVHGHFGKLLARKDSLQFFATLI
jgi:hypothetical protein